MLEEIRISGLGVIESSTLELGPGLSVITGETGAGKTMVVTALGLLLGGRADSGAVRVGAKSARVEGLVRADESVCSGVLELGGEVEDDTVLLARNIASEGRSRAFVGGASVPVASLGQLAAGLVAIHGQSDQHRLLKSKAQRDALDEFGGSEIAKLLKSWRRDYAALQGVEAELVEVVRASRERAQEADLLRFGLGEIEAVEPKVGEDLELAAEETRLGAADTLRGAAEEAREALSSELDRPDALSAVARARHSLESVVEHDTQVKALSERLREVSFLLADVAADVASYASDVEADPVRLAVVSERRAALTGLTRKYGDTVDEVLAWAENSARRLVELDGSDVRIEELKARRTSLRETLAATGSRLSQARTKAAARLAGAVTEELTQLAMPHARLRLTVSQREDPEGGSRPDGPGRALEIDGRWLSYGSAGLDDVEFLLAANKGSEPRALDKGASGGELSRVMLGLEVALSGTSPVPTFVFDEVDAGVGGKAAVEIGRRLAKLARSAQVLVVTHLPQVAAYADRHVVVRKSSDGSVTTSGLTVLDEAERVVELSRMLAGQEDSETAVAHARELLKTAREG